ncbi:hypothetical protein [Ekhidna sp.]|uniref:M61 family metallopeptidase n=1 Tax=Ekhidna sp. TaxID=2608089 RepID=UPI00329782D3
MRKLVTTFPSAIKKLITYVFIIFCASNGYSQSNLKSQNRYKIKVVEKKLRLVEVQATILVKDSKLQMRFWGCPPEIEKGWAEFVEILSISNEEGESIDFEWNDLTREWDLNIRGNSIINLLYKVNLSHDNHNWDSAGGIDGRPTVWLDNTIFWATAGLFVYSKEEHPAEYEITFDVPVEWKISTAWVQSSNRIFIAKNSEELINNLLMMGNHSEKVIQVDNMSLTIATPSNFSHRIELIHKSLEQILPAYREIFGELPSANYLVCASKNEIQDGEAFRNSFHQMFQDKDLEHTKIVWANTLAHEMFHYWNGTNFLYSEDYKSNYWFSEGFTEYYSALTLLRVGIIDEEDHLRWLAYQFARMNTAQMLDKDRISLVDAGKKKGENWFLIYGGGATMAFILDVEIRSKTNGVKSLDDFMKVLYLKYGKEGKPISLEIQIQELNKLAKVDFRPFFDSYIIGNDPAFEAINNACEKAGLALAYYQRDFYLNLEEMEEESIYRSMSK